MIQDPRLLDFLCPLCGSNNCAFVSFARKDGTSYISKLFQCGGCSVVFGDREAFSQLMRDTYDSGRLWRDRRPTRSWTPGEGQA